MGRRGRCWSAWTSLCVCSALLGPPSAAALRWARLGSAAVVVHLKIQDVMASRVWGKGGITNSCSQFSRGLHIGVEPEPFQSSSHLGKGKGPSRMLLSHPLAGNGTGLHFEYMFKNTLERAYYYCYLFSCWLCLILYKQTCNCKGISQALANVYHCATGCSLCCVTSVINVYISTFWVHWNLRYFGE